MKNKRYPIFSNVRLYIRIVALSVVLAFGAEQLAYAAPPSPTPGGAITPGFSVQDIIENPAKLQIPLRHAAVREIHSSIDKTVSGANVSNNKLIIHIQDAHANPSGQLNLAKTLDALMTQYGIHLVLSEGSAKDSTLDDVKRLASAKEWKIAAKRFLMDGIIKGEEYLNLTTDHPMQIRGVEYKSLYDRNLEVYGALAKKRKEILLYIHKIKISLNRVKNRLYPKALLDYESHYQSNSDDASDPRRIAELLTLSEQTGVPLQTVYPEANKLKLLKLAESQIDFEKASQEQEWLMNVLNQRGARDEVEEFVADSQDHKNQPVVQFSLLNCLFDIASRKGLRPLQFPALRQYHAYLESFSQMSLDSLLTELDRLEDDVYRRMLESEDARRLRVIERFLGLLEKAHEIRMSSNEFQMLILNEADFKTEGWEAFLNEKLREFGFLDELIPYENYFEEAKGTLHDFYSLVDKRDKAFVENASRIMDETNEQIAFLITGGYHTDHLAKLLREQGTSYVVLTPIVTAETDHDKYEKRLLEPLAKLKNQNKAHLARSDTRGSRPARSTTLRSTLLKHGVPQDLVDKLLNGGSNLNKETLWSIVRLLNQSAKGEASDLNDVHLPVNSGDTILNSPPPDGGTRVGESQPPSEENVGTRAARILEYLEKDLGLPVVSHGFQEGDVVLQRPPWILYSSENPHPVFGYFGDFGGLMNWADTSQYLHEIRSEVADSDADLLNPYIQYVEEAPARGIYLPDDPLEKMIHHPWVIPAEMMVPEVYLDDLSHDNLSSDFEVGTQIRFRPIDSGPGKRMPLFDPDRYGSFGAFEDAMRRIFFPVEMTVTAMLNHESPVVREMYNTIPLVDVHNGVGYDPLKNVWLPDKCGEGCKQMHNLLGQGGTAKQLEPLVEWMVNIIHRSYTHTAILAKFPNDETVYVIDRTLFQYKQIPDELFRELMLGWYAPFYNGQGPKPPQYEKYKSIYDLYATEWVVDDATLYVNPGVSGNTGDENQSIDGSRAETLEKWKRDFDSFLTKAIHFYNYFAMDDATEDYQNFSSTSTVYRKELDTLMKRIRKFWWGVGLYKREIDIGFQTVETALAYAQSAHDLNRAMDDYQRRFLSIIDRSDIHDFSADDMSVLNASDVSRQARMRDETQKIALETFDAYNNYFSRLIDTPFGVSGRILETLDVTAGPYQDRLRQVLFDAGEVRRFYEDGRIVLGNEMLRKAVRDAVSISKEFYRDLARAVSRFTEIRLRKIKSLAGERIQDSDRGARLALLAAMNDMTVIFLITLGFTVLKYLHKIWVLRGPEIESPSVYELLRDGTDYIVKRIRKVRQFSLRQAFYGVVIFSGLFASVRGVTRYLTRDNPDLPLAVQVEIMDLRNRLKRNPLLGPMTSPGPGSVTQIIRREISPLVRSRIDDASLFEQLARRDELWLFLNPNPSSRLFHYAAVANPDGPPFLLKYNPETDGYEQAGDDLDIPHEQRYLQSRDREVRYVQKSWSTGFVSEAVFRYGLIRDMAIEDALKYLEPNIYRPSEVIADVETMGGTTVTVHYGKDRELRYRVRTSGDEIGLELIPSDASKNDYDQKSGGTQGSRKAGDSVETFLSKELTGTRNSSDRSEKLVKTWNEPFYEGFVYDLWNAVQSADPVVLDFVETQWEETFDKPQAPYHIVGFHIVDRDYLLNMAHRSAQFNLSRTNTMSLAGLNVSGAIDAWLENLKSHEVTLPVGEKGLIASSVRNILQHVIPANDTDPVKAKGIVLVLASNPDGLEADDKRIHIYVLDTGPGMPVQEVMESRFLAGTSTYGMDLQGLVRSGQPVSYIIDSKGQRWDGQTKAIVEDPKDMPLQGVLVGISLGAFRPTGTRNSEGGANHRDSSLIKLFNGESGLNRELPLFTGTRIGAADASGAYEPSQGLAAISAQKRHETGRPEGVPPGIRNFDAAAGEFTQSGAISELSADLLRAIRSVDAKLDGRKELLSAGDPSTEESNIIEFVSRGISGSGNVSIPDGTGINYHFVASVIGTLLASLEEDKRQRAYDTDRLRNLEIILKKHAVNGSRVVKASGDTILNSRSVGGARLSKIGNLLSRLIPEGLTVGMMVFLGISAMSWPAIAGLFMAGSVSMRGMLMAAGVIHGAGHTFLTALYDRDAGFVTWKHISENLTRKDIAKGLIPFQPIPSLLVTERERSVPTGTDTSKRAIRFKSLGFGANIGVAALTAGLGLWVPDFLESAGDLGLAGAHYPAFLYMGWSGANALRAISLPDIAAFASGTAVRHFCGIFGHIGPPDTRGLYTSRDHWIMTNMMFRTALRGWQAVGWTKLVHYPEWRFSLLPKEGRGNWDSPDRARYEYDHQKDVRAEIDRLEKRKSELTNDVEIYEVNDQVHALRREVPYNPDHVGPIHHKWMNHRRGSLMREFVLGWYFKIFISRLLGHKPLQKSISISGHTRFATEGGMNGEETHFHRWVGPRQAMVWLFRQGKLFLAKKILSHSIGQNGDLNGYRIISFNLHGEDRTLRELKLWLQRVLGVADPTKGDARKYAGLMDFLITQGMWFASLRYAYHMTVPDSYEEAMSTEMPSERDLEYMADVFEKSFMKMKDNLFMPDATSLSQYIGGDNGPVQTLIDAILSIVHRDIRFRHIQAGKRRDFVKRAVHAFLENDSFHANIRFLQNASYDSTSGSIVESTLDTFPQTKTLISKGQPVLISRDKSSGRYHYASDVNAAKIIADQDDVSLFWMDPEGMVAQIGREGLLRVYSSIKRRELTTDEIAKGWIEGRDNPNFEHAGVPLSPPPGARVNAVRKDVRSIPDEARRIRESWEGRDDDLNQDNLKTADNLLHHLQGKMSPDGTKPKLLVVGIEKSYELSERFVKGLRMLFPHKEDLDAEFMDAADFLKQIQDPSSTFLEDEQYVILFISESGGQTFPTIRAAMKAEELKQLRRKGKVTQKKVVETFALTRGPDTWMRYVMGKKFRPRSPKNRRILTTGGTPTMTEPASVTVMRLGQTLNHLSFFIAEGLIQSGVPVGRRTQEPIQDQLARSREILGYVKQGMEETVEKLIPDVIRGESFKEIEEDANKKALEVQEGWITILFTAFVIVTVGYGLLASWPAWVNATIIYGFGSWIANLIWRYVTGRQVMSRLGPRTFANSDQNPDLLGNFIEIQASQAFGWFGVNRRSDLPKQAQHLWRSANRGWILFLGIPNGERDQTVNVAALEVRKIKTSTQANTSVGGKPQVVLFTQDKQIANEFKEESILIPSVSIPLPRSLAVDEEAKALVSNLTEHFCDYYVRLAAEFSYMDVLFDKVTKVKIPLTNIVIYVMWDRSRSQPGTQASTTPSPTNAPPKEIVIDDEELPELSPPKAVGRDTRFTIDVDLIEAEEGRGPATVAEKFWHQGKKTLQRSRLVIFSLVQVFIFHLTFRWLWSEMEPAFTQAGSTISPETVFGLSMALQWGLPVLWGLIWLLIQVLDVRLRPASPRRIQQFVHKKMLHHPALLLLRGQTDTFLSNTAAAYETLAAHHMPPWDIEANFLSILDAIQILERGGITVNPEQIFIMYADMLTTDSLEDILKRYLLNTNETLEAMRQDETFVRKLTALFDNLALVARPMHPSLVLHHLYQEVLENEASLNTPDDVFGLFDDVLIRIFDERLNRRFETDPAADSVTARDSHIGDAEAVFHSLHAIRRGISDEPGRAPASYAKLVDHMQISLRHLRTFRDYAGGAADRGELEGRLAQIDAFAHVLITSRNSLFGRHLSEDQSKMMIAVDLHHRMPELSADDRDETADTVYEILKLIFPITAGSRSKNKTPSTPIGSGFQYDIDFLRSVMKRRQGFVETMLGRKKGSGAETLEHFRDSLDDHELTDQTGTVDLSGFNQRLFDQAEREGIFSNDDPRDVHAGLFPLNWYLLSLKHGDVNAPDEAETKRIAAIALDNYLLHRLISLSLRIWDDGRPNENLTKLQELLNELQGQEGSGQKFLDYSTDLLVMAYSKYAKNDSIYYTLARKIVNTLDKKHLRRFIRNYIEHLSSHLKGVFHEVGGFIMHPSAWIELYDVRENNHVDYFLLYYFMPILMKDYARLTDESDIVERIELAETLLMGISADPLLFLNEGIDGAFNLLAGQVVTKSILSNPTQSTELINFKMEPWAKRYFEDLRPLRIRLHTDSYFIDRGRSKLNLERFPDLSRYHLFAKTTLDTAIGLSMQVPGYESISYNSTFRTPRGDIATSDRLLSAWQVRMQRAGTVFRNLREQNEGSELQIHPELLTNLTSYGYGTNPVWEERLFNLVRTSLETGVAGTRADGGVSSDEQRLVWEDEREVGLAGEKRGLFHETLIFKPYRFMEFFGISRAFASETHSVVTATRTGIEAYPFESNYAGTRTIDSPSALRKAVSPTPSAYPEPMRRKTLNLAITFQNARRILSDLINKQPRVRILHVRDLEAYIPETEYLKDGQIPESLSQGFLSVLKGLKDQVMRDQAVGWFTGFSIPDDMKAYLESLRQSPDADTQELVNMILRSRVDDKDLSELEISEDTYIVYSLAQSDDDEADRHPLLRKADPDLEDQYLGYDRNSNPITYFLVPKAQGLTPVTEGQLMLQSVTANLLGRIDPEASIEDTRSVREFMESISGLKTEPGDMISLRKGRLGSFFFKRAVQLILRIMPFRPDFEQEAITKFYTQIAA